MSIPRVEWPHPSPPLPPSSGPMASSRAVCDNLHSAKQTL